jgi:hypothetical protein
MSDLVEGQTMNNQAAIEVTIQHEQKRGCGYRKPAVGGVGIYLMSGKLTATCDRLPFPLDVCPCCSAGIKQTRAFTWIQPRKLFESAFAAPCVYGDATCSMGPNAPEKAGLLWIGEQYYATPDAFLQEAAILGISRKLPAIPRGFKVGETRIYLAHSKAIAYEGLNGEGIIATKPGVFASFIPTSVDLVIDDPNQIPERALKLKERLGDFAQLVKVLPIEVLEVLATVPQVQKSTAKQLALVM